MDGAPFKIGEFVVCVDAGGIRGLPQLQCGGIYTISDITNEPSVFVGALPSIHYFPGIKHKWMVHLMGMPSPHETWYAASRFSPYRPEHTLDEISQKKEVTA